MQQQQRRLYAFAIGLVAILVIGTVLLPWVRLTRLGIPVGWNGLGRTGDAVMAREGVGPHAYGWYVIAAAVLALLAAGLLLGSAATARRSAWALWAAAAGALAATAVPIVTLTDPDWLLGDFFAEIGARDLVRHIGRDFLNIPVLGFTIGGLVLLAVLCAGTALAVRPITTRIRISVDRGTPEPGEPAGEASRAAGSPPSG